MQGLVPCWHSYARVLFQISSHIKHRVQELGHGCAALVTKAGALQCSPSDAYTKKELIESARKVSEKASGLERGVMAWVYSLSTPQGACVCVEGYVLSDSLLFKEGILKTATALVEDTKVMVTNVTSLLKTVKAVEDEAMKGTQALEATIENIRQELAVFSSPMPPAKVSTPKDLIRMMKGITMAMAKAVAAGNSCRQENVITTANLSHCAIVDMLCTCKILQKPTHELKQQLAGYSKHVASSVTKLIQAAEAMEGTEWVDPEDPIIITENELLGAAAAIEAAAKKLEQLKPRAKPKAAGNAVKRALDNLVKAAQKAAAFQDYNEMVVVKEKLEKPGSGLSIAMVEALAIPSGGSCDPGVFAVLSLRIIATQEEMLHKERELEEMQKKLAMIWQQQYRFLPSELRDEEQN
ncbi:talihypothetical protein [Limosa lapponica baueri]|uniref:Vinculin-binding site-containing domain-containing protein n=1 Tax=Limosa lapponica baueri TaxID=1758121 RepID=A0A2I0TTL8_LIMLA|nr:talihypothetical protein [Limosa lapponica baueri]